MSLLNWVLAENYVTILTDTLATRGEGHERRPLLFCAKVFASPHQQTIFAGTGYAQVVQGFALRSMSDSLALNVDQLAMEAPDVIRAIWDHLGLPPEPDPMDMRSTVHIFGWSEEQERFRGFSFRSTDKFEREEMAYAFGFKPCPSWITPMGDSGVHSFEDMIAIARRQKAEEEVAGKDWPVHIGGELVAYCMQRGTHGTVMELNTWGRFGDFDRDRLAILARAAAARG